MSSSDFPQWDRNLNTGGEPAAEPASAAVVATQAVFHDAARPSRLRLPIDQEPLVIFDSHMHVGSFESMFGVVARPRRHRRR